MPARVIVTGVVLVVLVTLTVSMVEFFPPLSARSEMSLCCRNTLLRMEIEGGLSVEAKEDLEIQLSKRGFYNISISGTPTAKQGQKINLRVEADYTYSRLKGLFVRSDVTQRMVYDKTSIARKVVN